MIRLLKWLFTGDGHIHKWKIIDTAALVRTSDNTEAGSKHTLQCYVCGDIKIVNDYV